MHERKDWPTVGFVRVRLSVQGNRRGLQMMLINSSCRANQLGLKLTNSAGHNRQQ
jgi:hypothetical protein